jgi:hypothetical protein
VGFRRPQPLLVTGVPRSGTTWLARLLASSPGCAMTGREPMNPRASQFGLGGTLHGWTRLSAPSPQQRRILRRCYSGWSLRVYSRYGVRQFAAPWPGTRLVVKDPFAMLSTMALGQVTGARPVLIYRHPGAVLASYRRMGWTPDVEEVEHLDGAAAYHRYSTSGDANEQGDVQAMAYFWSTLHEFALQDLEAMSQAVVVSHEELAAGGGAALRSLFAACDLAWGATSEQAIDKPGTQAPERRSERSLHTFNRPSAEVAHGWRSQVSHEDVEALESGVGDVLARLSLMRLHLTPDQPTREVTSDG